MGCLSTRVYPRKLLLLGDGACGKTSALNVFTRDYFPEDYEPTVFENYVHDVNVDGKVVELSLWDTAGQEEFDRLRSLSYAHTHVVMICFSVDNRDSLDNVETKWLYEILEYSPGVKVILAALKCDLREDEETIRYMGKMREHPVTYEEGLQMARRIQAVKYVECSAKYKVGVKESFEEAARVAVGVRVSDREKKCLVM
ncbi:Rho GTPase [Basidiobolus ranarum]|uniref:Rho GTPase n=1 Tax=Basidiobolus ranarum TaxID=34480 RepID=A0ABR2WVZ5_9FUNG